MVGIRGNPESDKEVSMIRKSKNEHPTPSEEIIAEERVMTLKCRHQESVQIPAFAEHPGIVGQTEISQLNGEHNSTADLQYNTFTFASWIIIAHRGYFTMLYYRVYKTQGLYKIL